LADPTPLPKFLQHPIVSQWDDLLEGIATPDDWARKRLDVKKRFLQLIRNEAAPKVPMALDIRVEQEFDTDGFQLRRISYNVECDERAHAYLAIPPGAAPAGGFPAVLCIHGTGNWEARRLVGLPPEPGDPHADQKGVGLDHGRMLAQRGYVTLSPEHFCCGTRLPKEGPFDTAAFYRKHPRWSAVGKSTFENHIALNVLQSFPYVDGARLGVTGHSLGAQNSIFLAAYDDRVRCVAPSCAATTFRESPQPLQWSRDRWYIYFPQLREQLLRGERIACDFHEMLALAAPRPLLEFFALNDTDFSCQAHRAMLHLKLRELYRLLGSEAAHAFLVFGDGHSSPRLTRDALVSWMDRWLKHDGAPNW
jgi:dienelactone hydrolase